MTMAVVLGLLTLCAVAALGMAIWRIVVGPTDADRVVALDIFLAAALGLCVAASLATGRTVYLDVGLGLALVGFVAPIGWARLIDRSSSRDAERAGGTGEPRARDTAPVRIAQSGTAGRTGAGSRAGTRRGRGARR